MSLKIDIIFPQHFHNYTVFASNSEGNALLNFQLAQGTNDSFVQLFIQKNRNIPLIIYTF